MLLSSGATVLRALPNVRHGYSTFALSRVTKREVNQRTAAVLDQVTEADDVVVTERGTPRWRVSAFRDQSSRLARMEREGRYSLPTPNPAHWPTEPRRADVYRCSVEALLDEMSDDHGAVGIVDLDSSIAVGTVLDVPERVRLQACGRGLRAGRVQRAGWRIGISLVSFSQWRRLLTRWVEL